MEKFSIYKFNILSTIEYNNIFFNDNKIPDNTFDILTLNITQFDMDVFNTGKFELIHNDYLKLDKYTDKIFNFYNKNMNSTLIGKDILLINLDSIMDSIVAIIDLYSI